MSEKSEETSNNCDVKSEESESLISKTLDIFLFGPLLSVLPKKYISRQFISGFLLSAFLLWLYIDKGLLFANFSPHMIVLYVVIFLTSAELIRKNFPILNKWFSNDQKSLNFFNNINSMTDDQMRRFVRFHIFSSKCINKFVSIVKQDINKIPPDIVEYALTTQDLTKENLDLIFSDEIVFDEKIVKKILFDKKDQLTEQNIRNIFEKFRSNSDVIKLLFATQNGSKILLNAEQNNELVSYYEKYQKNYKHLDGWLRRIPITWSFLSQRRAIIVNTFIGMAAISSLITIVLAIFYAFTCEPSCISADTFFKSVLNFWLLSLVISFGLSRYLVIWFTKRYFDHFIWKVETV